MEGLKEIVKKQNLKDYIKETGHSTNCSTMVFWQMNPFTIQEYMNKENIGIDILDKALNEINSEI